MYNYLIYSQLKNHAKEDRAFHMPGHKARGDFKSKFGTAHLDVTELSYSDNLLCPSGVIAEAQKDIAEILGAKNSFILTDGSSSGILAMAYALSGFGSKVIVPRNSHVSVWNACRLFNLEPVIVQGETSNGILLPPSEKLIERLLENDVTIAGMIVASPDYYGNVAPLAGYAKALKAHKRFLAVDGAHGAHLAFENRENGLYAGVYADIWVDGAHKTLPTLTQGAIVSCNNDKLSAGLKEGLSMFRTTSPSFPVAASVEYGVKYVANNPQELSAAKTAVAEFRASCPLPLYPSDDWAKLAVDCEPLGASSDDVAEILENKGIYAELSDGRYVLFYLSPMTVKGDLNRLNSALASIVHNKKLKKSYKKLPVLPPAERTYSYLYAFKQRRELVPLKDAKGRMCAQNAGIAPPCTPVIIAGEIITEASIKILNGAKSVFGLENGKVWCVKK